MKRLCRLQHSFVKHDSQYREPADQEHEGQQNQNNAHHKEDNPRNSGGGVLFPFPLAKKKGTDDDESKCNQKHIRWPFKN